MRSPTASPSAGVLNALTPAVPAMSSVVAFALKAAGTTLTNAERGLMLDWLRCGALE
ncbi:MAG: hypothetical protein Q8K32_30225 [Archangium sp.]|nr:hypothetical protein [Archangium sp.]